MNNSAHLLSCSVQVSRWFRLCDVRQLFTDQPGPHIICLPALLTEHKQEVWCHACLDMIRFERTGSDRFDINMLPMR